MTNCRKACGSSFLSFHWLIAGSSPGDGFSSCWDRRPYCSALAFTAVPVFGRKLQDKTLAVFFLARRVCSQGADPSARLFQLSSPPEEVQLPLRSRASPMGFILRSWQEHGGFSQSLANIKGCHAYHCISNAKLCGHPAYQPPLVPVWALFSSRSLFPGLGLKFCSQFGFSR